MPIPDSPGNNRLDFPVSRMLAIVVSIHEVVLHCPKAFMRSRLWNAAARVKRPVLPTLGEMIRDQSGMEGPVKTQDHMIERCKASL